MIVIARSEATSLTRALKSLHFSASSTGGYTDFSGIMAQTAPNFWIAAAPAGKVRLIAKGAKSHVALDLDRAPRNNLYPNIWIPQSAIAITN